MLINGMKLKWTVNALLLQPMNKLEKELQKKKYNRRKIQ